MGFLSNNANISKIAVLLTLVIIVSGGIGISYYDTSQQPQQPPQIVISPNPILTPNSPAPTASVSPTVIPTQPATPTPNIPASNSSTSIFNKFLIGTGSATWRNLQDINSKYSLNMNLATSWINSRHDLYGWWSNYFLPEPLWNQSIIPHLITYRYFYNEWGIDYSSANLRLHRQDWLNDLAYMANCLKAPNDGKHIVLVSLETEFNDPSCYENIDYVYWNQLMIDSRNVIKEIAPNVLVSYCFGCWTARFNDDISMNGALASSMRSMDFMSFQCMWGVKADKAETKWLNGDDLKTTYQGVNWVNKFGYKSNIWDYMIDDITTNIEALSKYNPNILLAHFSVNDYLWGTQSQVDVVNQIIQKEASLKELGLFGISWMHYIDKSSIGGDGFLFLDGSAKPCLPHWGEFVNNFGS